jgi:hypothetical protein
MTKLLTLPKFAQACGISEWLARRLVLNGDIPSVLVGTRRRIDERWVERWLDAGNPEPTPVSPAGVAKSSAADTPESETQ